MKPIKYLIAAALVSSALFTGCTKDASTSGTAAYDTKTMAPMANITFRVQTIPQRPGYMLQWTEGSMITSEVSFTGSFLNGDPVEQQTYQSKGYKVIDLVTPSITTIGTVSVPYHNYLTAMFAVNLNPINSTTSLVLKGQYYQIQPPSGIAPNPFKPVPVIIAISTQATLNGMRLSKLGIDQGNYTVTIDMDVNQLTNGIDDAAMSVAAQTNGTIIISNESNPNLYGVIVKNLESYMMNLQFAVQATGTPVNPAQ